VILLKVGPVEYELKDPSATVCCDCGRLLRVWQLPNFKGAEVEIHPEHGDRNVCEDCIIKNSRGK
jgi:hypothetical protein